jgi:hypothetical protein
MSLLDVVVDEFLDADLTNATHQARHSLATSLPTAKAIDGLEKALAGLGLLDGALAMDLRKPQDYFQRVWSTAFRASDLAAAGQDESEHSDECTAADDEEACA